MVEVGGVKVEMAAGSLSRRKVSVADLTEFIRILAPALIPVMLYRKREPRERVDYSAIM
jgi:hypothetical protein